MRHTSTRTSSESGRVDNSFGFEEKQKAAARWKRDGFLSNAGCCFLGYAAYYLLTTICGAVCSSCHPLSGAPQREPRFASQSASCCLSNYDRAPASFCLTRKIKIIESRGR